MADVARGIKTAVLRAQTATPARVPVENAPDEGRRAPGEALFVASLCQGCAFY